MSQLVKYVFLIDAPKGPIDMMVLVNSNSNDPVSSFSQERLKACDVVAFGEAQSRCETLGTTLIKYHSGPEDYDL